MSMTSYIIFYQHFSFKKWQCHHILFFQYIFLKNANDIIIYFFPNIFLLRNINDVIYFFSDKVSIIFSVHHLHIYFLSISYLKLLFINWFNRQELLEKAKHKYQNGGGKERVNEYYQEDKDVAKEKKKNKYNNFPEEEKKAKRQYSKNRYNKMKENTDLFLQYKDE